MGFVSTLWKTAGLVGAGRQRQPAPRHFESPSPAGAAKHPPTYISLNTRLTDLEKRVQQQDIHIRSTASADHIVASMEHVFNGVTADMDRRFAEQQRSIEDLKTAIHQTDELLEKVLDSIYSLQDQAGASVAHR